MIVLAWCVVCLYNCFKGNCVVQNVSVPCVFCYLCSLNLKLKCSIRRNMNFVYTSVLECIIWKEMLFSSKFCFELLICYEHVFWAKSVLNNEVATKIIVVMQHVFLYSYVAFLLIENAFWRCLIIIDFQVRKFKVEVRTSTSKWGNLEFKCGNPWSKCGNLESKCDNSESKCGTGFDNDWLLCVVLINKRSQNCYRAPGFEVLMIWCLWMSSYLARANNNRFIADLIQSYN